MIALLNGLTLFGEPVVLLVLIALAFACLETERAWTRKRRRHGLEPGAISYLLDGLVLSGVALVLVGIGTLVIAVLTSIARLLGGVFHGEQPGLLIVAIAAAVGLTLALVWIASRRRAAQNIVRAGEFSAPLVGLSANVAEVGLASPAEYQPAYAPTPRLLQDEEPSPPLALLQERWQPGAAPAASAPTSFLELAQPQSVAPARSRFAFVRPLLMLALVALLVSGAILFRGQLIGLFSGPDTSGGVVAVTRSGEGAIQPDTSGEQPAVIVSGAGLPAASAPTAVSQVVAPPPANEAQSGTKRVKSDNLNVRAQPGIGQQVVLVLTKGSAVTVLTDARLISDTIWVKVRVGDQEGWVDQSLLE